MPLYLSVPIKEQNHSCFLDSRNSTLSLKNRFLSKSVSLDSKQIFEESFSPQMLFEGSHRGSHSVDEDFLCVHFLIKDLTQSQVQ